MNIDQPSLRVFYCIGRKLLLHDMYMYYNNLLVTSIVHVRAHVYALQPAC